MNKIEDLKRKQKELEYNKKQLEAQIESVTAEIEILKSQRFYLNAFGYISNIPNYFDENTVGRMIWIGNYFETVEEAEKEVKKRELKKEIEEFRNERNGNWQPDWLNNLENKYYLTIVNGQKMSVSSSYYLNIFPKFGYFKESSDAHRAIEIFGDKIMELYLK